jgi:transposase
VKQERLDWLADNPFYTKRFAFHIGRRCRHSSIRDVAKEHLLDWKTVKALEMQYMREQIKRAGQPSSRLVNPGPRSLALTRSRSERAKLTDRRRGIWFWGKNRSEESMDMFFAFLGERSSKRVRLAVMDMWKPFRKSTNKKAPQAAILFDKFHILSHLGDALDKVRKQEYAQLDGEKRKYIKGQKYALLSHKENLQGSARKNLKILLAANKRLNTAYVLKESFGQLWDYNRESWARKFFENWRDQLKWQRLKPYEKFAEMIDARWDGIAAYCKPDNKVPLGFVEGLNNKIRVIQRRAYGLRDEEYLRLKVLSCMLPEI